MTTSTDTALRDEIVELARELIRRPSVTPDDAGCQPVIGEYLAARGFDVTHQRFGDVDNTWARHGDARPLLVLLGHTDVVPPGPESAWRFPPFSATLHDGMIWGRGAADMKGSVAAMVVAAGHFARRHPSHPGSLAILLTSDEEGPALDGIRRMAPWLAARDESPDYCVVGEPSSGERFGDALRVGRRGTLSGELTVHGIQGHVAYPDLARNPVHVLAPAFAELVACHWDDGDADFPPTSFQVSNLHAGTGADNVIPGEARVRFNFRYGTANTAEGLRARVRAVLDDHGVDYALDWRHGGEPFRTPAGHLRTELARAVEAETGMTPVPSTAGGTSDGRFIAGTGADVVEFGPRNGTIHQIDERIAVDELAATAAIHLRLAGALLG